MKKNQAVLVYLVQDMEVKTKDVIHVLKNQGITVSERYVQQIRKDIIDGKCEHAIAAIKKELESKKGDENKMTDVFDTADSQPVPMEDWEISLVNLANEGGWSIQQLAEHVPATLIEVREALEKFKNMINGDVLDEDNNDFFEVQENNVETVTGADPSIPGISTSEFSVLEEPTDETNVGKNNLRTYRPPEEFWEVKIDCVTACSKVPKEIDVFVNKSARTKAMLFMKWAGAREWLAYLVGEFDDEKNAYLISDLYVPDQRTSASLVDKVEAEEYNQMNIVGVIHSHHEMGAGDENNPSFSGHDSAFINSNHNLSLLAGRDRKTGGFKVVGIARIDTPCGGKMKIKASVKATPEPLTEEEAALKSEFTKKCFTKANTGLYGTGMAFVGGSQISNNGVFQQPVVDAMGKKTYRINPASGVVETRGRSFHFNSSK